MTHYQDMNDASLDKLLADLRAEKERIQNELRAAVKEYDRRAQEKEILKRFPQAGQVLRPVGIKSEEAMGGTGG